MDSVGVYWASNNAAVVVEQGGFNVVFVLVCTIYECVFFWQMKNGLLSVFESKNNDLSLFGQQA